MAGVEKFVDLQMSEKFQEAVKLNDVDCINDPENDPYRSKYKAREIWHELKLELDKCDSESPDEILVVLTAALDLKLGSNYAETEELSTGEEHLNKCVEKLKEHRLDHRACNILQNALNQLGILWTGRRQAQRALEYLQEAETLYKTFQQEQGNAPWQMDELFDVGDGAINGERDAKRSNNFEDTYTLTLYYLAQVYGKLEDNKKSAEYCHVTLHRQLDMMKYEPIDWALNAATLSQYYITHNEYPMARHCLASACQILKEAGEPKESLSVKVKDEESQEELTEREKIPKTWADIYRCWIKYGLSLLEHSRDRLYDQLESENSEPDNDLAASAKKHDNKSASEGHEDEDNKHKLKFNIELTAMEKQITDENVLDFEQAREVFLVVQKWLNSSKEFYVLDGHCTDHIELIQDHSKLYKLLAFFEPNFDRQCKMHKRRADMLQNVLNELSMQFYLLICRQVIYEVAEIYSCILDIKLAIIEESGALPKIHAGKKLNILAAQSIEYYTKYLDSLKTPDKKDPDTYPEDDERPAMVAHFCMARLYSKFLEVEVVKRLANTKKSLDTYQFLVNYCKRNPKCLEIFKSEYEICEEMVALLPAKMERVRAKDGN